MEHALKREFSLSESPEWCARIAQEIDLSQLTKRCPEGFPPFAQQVRELLKE